MNAMMKDTPISLGLPLEVLRGRRMEQMGAAHRELRDLRSNQAASIEIELAGSRLEDARAAVGECQRLSDDEARKVLEREGVTLCRS